VNLRDFFKPSDARLYGKAHKRLSRTPKPVAVGWAFQTTISLQQAVEVYQLEGDEAALVEMRQGAIALLAAADVFEGN
jgi:hypothetical protein